MSEENKTDNDPERTLVTLEQLSQTIEVMTSVVNRLRQHLSDQLQAKLTEQEAQQQTALQGKTQDDAQQEEKKDTQDILKSKQQHQQKQQISDQSTRESFVVEIRQQEPEPVLKDDKTLH